MFNAIDKSNDLVESLAVKLQKGELTKEDLDKEYEKDEVKEITEMERRAHEVLERNVQLLTESEKSQYLDCLIREEMANYKYRKALRDLDKK